MDVVLQLRNDDLIHNVIAQVFLQKRRQHFDTAVQITRHQVGAAKVHLLISVVMEVVDASMFQKTSDDRTNCDRIGNAGQAGAQTADTANDTFDLHTGAAGFIKNLDHFIVNQLVALNDDMAVAVLLVLFDFAANQLGDAGTQRVRRHQQLAVMADQTVAGHHIKQILDVIVDVFISREET